MLLNFSDRTRTGVFNMEWPLPRTEVKRGSQEMESGPIAGNAKVNEIQGFLYLGHSNWTICSLLS